MNLSTEREHENGRAKLKVLPLPFSAIPGQSRLFIEYLNSPESLRAFYPNSVESINGLTAFVPTVLANYSTDRGELCDALIEINTSAGAGSATLANIEMLREGNTVAVLTGQQAGLFTGPLYTIYKALSAIKTAEVLTQAGTKAVPVFWAATEDHDFEEVSESWFVDSTGGLARAHYRPALYVENTPVGDVPLGFDVADVVEKFVNSLPQGEFSEDVREMLLRTWQPGIGFGDAFCRTVIQLLGKYGLILIEPLNPKIKKLAAHIFVPGIQNAGKIVDAVMARSSQLVSSGYHAQVTVGADHFPFFWIDNDGRRIAFRKTGEGFYRAKGEKQEFTTEQLANIALEEPNRFSPGVMMRPIVQDYLFPTVCYFGGAAEIAYFAQNSVVYELLGRPVTPILHRQSFTVVGPRQGRSLEKLGLKLTDLFEGSEAVKLRAAGSSIALELARLFADVEERINGELNRLDQELSQIDTTLAANFAKRRRKIIYHIGAMKKKTILAKARRDESFRRRVDDVLATLWPNDGLQERSLNVYSLYNKYGPNVIDWIYDAIDLNDKDHRVIEL